MDNYENAARKFLKDGGSIGWLSKEFDVEAKKLTKIIKEQYGITNVKSYGSKKSIEHYEKLFDEYTTLNEPIKLFCKRHHISRRRFESFIATINTENVVAKFKYKVNNRIFDTIDSEEKAYWLGFLYADGFNSGAYHTITINSIDFNHLKKYRHFLQATHKIRYRKSDHTVSISISDKHICDQLTKKGCIRGKTYKGHFPSTNSLPRIYFRDFIRGYFDGDGCINKMFEQNITSVNSLSRKINKLSISVKQEYMAKQLQKAIEMMCTGIKVNLSHSVLEKYNTDQYEIYIEGQSNVRYFLDTIYREAHVYLDRKYAQYLRYILPSDLEIDQIINAKLSGNVLPDLYPEEKEIDRIIRTEGILYEELDHGDMIDKRELGQGQSVESEAMCV